MDSDEAEQVSLHALVMSLEKTGKLRQQMKRATKWWQEPRFEPEIEDAYKQDRLRPMLSAIGIWGMFSLVLSLLRLTTVGVLNVPESSNLPYVYLALIGLPSTMFSMIELDRAWIAEQKNLLHNLGVACVLAHWIAIYWAAYDAIHLCKSNLTAPYVQTGMLISLIPTVTQSSMLCPLWVWGGMISMGLLILATGPYGPPVFGLIVFTLAELAFLRHTDHNNRARFLSRLNVTRLEMEAKHSKDATQQIRTEAIMRQERLQLQLQLLKSQIGCESQSLVSTATEIQRPACLMGAWGEGTNLEEKPATADNAPPPNVTFPCVAAFVTEGNTFASRMLKRTGLDKEMRIKTGSHPFVVLDGEDFLRVGIIKSAFGEAKGHPMLANKQPALYAGVLTLLFAN